MRIEFNIVLLSEEESLILNDFLESVVINIRSDILKEVVPAKLNMLQEDLLNADWMIWKKKPLRIDMMSLVKLITNNIGYYERRNYSFTICINPTALYPASSTRLDTIARFIDKGTETCPATTFMSKVFNKYYKEIEELWDSYVKYRLNRKRTSKVVFK